MCKWRSLLTSCYSSDVAFTSCYSSDVAFTSCYSYDVASSCDIRLILVVLEFH